MVYKKVVEKSKELGFLHHHFCLYPCQQWSFLSYERRHQGHLQQEDSCKFHLIKHHSQISMNDIF